jgi:hypothetical protein
VAMEVFKNEPFTIDANEIKEAYETAELMKKSYKMIDDTESLISQIRAELRDEIIANKNEILVIKDKLEKSGEIL